MSSLSSTIGGVAAITSLGSMAPPPMGTVATLAAEGLKIGAKLIGNKEAKDEAERQRKLKEEADAKAKEQLAEQEAIARTNKAMTLAPDQANSQWFKFGNNGQESFEMSPERILTEAEPLSREGYRLHGNTHAQGGIAGDNNTVAEDKEAIYKGMTFSNQEGPSGLTYSDEATAIMKERASLEEEKDATIDTHEQNSIARYLQITDERLKRLFQTQGNNVAAAATQKA